MPPNERITILVNQRPHHVNQPVLTANQIRALVDAPDDYEVWKVVKDPDTEGQLPVDDQQITDTVEVMSGDRFRVVPPGTFGTAAALSDPIRDAATVVEGMGYSVTLHHEGGLGVLLIAAYPLRSGWSKSSTRLLLKLPPSFPAGKPDMFWTDQDLVLANGAVPKQAGHIEVILGASWRRFSWHPSSWKPGVDDIRTFFEFVARRLADPQ
jgi:hypothetical protein